MRTLVAIMVVGSVMTGALTTACKKHTVQSAEFRTMAACLEGIKKHSGTGNLKIVTDRKDEVSGFLSDGRAFGCEVVESGSKGTYISGYYDND